MSQKFKKIRNKNDGSTAYGKWFATAVYDQHFFELGLRFLCNSSQNSAEYPKNLQKRKRNCKFAADFCSILQFIASIECIVIYKTR